VQFSLPSDFSLRRELANLRRQTSGTAPIELFPDCDTASNPKPPTQVPKLRIGAKPPEAARRWHKQPHRILGEKLPWLVVIVAVIGICSYVRHSPPQLAISSGIPGEGTATVDVLAEKRGEEPEEIADHEQAHATVVNAPTSKTESSWGDTSSQPGSRLDGLPDVPMCKSEVETQKPMGKAPRDPRLPVVTRQLLARCLGVGLSAVVLAAAASARGSTWVMQVLSKVLAEWNAPAGHGMIVTARRILVILVRGWSIVAKIVAKLSPEPHFDWG
jgi:hypothetical protein